MPSPIDICNMALGEVGARDTITSFNEGTKEAKYCGVWYDKMRQALLRAAPWGFARTQVVLSPLGDLASGTSIYPWPFKYLYPADCLKARFLLPPTPLDNSGAILFEACVPNRANRFIVANDPVSGMDRKVLLGTLQSAQLVYVKDVTDVTLFDSQFEIALAAAIAAKICLPITGNKDMRAQFIASASDAIITARASDGNEAMPSTDHTPDWISARGDPGMAYNTPFWDLGLWYAPWDNMSWAG